MEKLYKKYAKEFATSLETQTLNKLIKAGKKSGDLRTIDISDGYHTIGELYEHRMALTVALCHMIERFNYDVEVNSPIDKELYCYKSWKHHDNTMFDGMFIVVIETPYGQISYHYNAEHWDKFDIPTKEKANEYDGHIPNDTIERLLNL